MTQRPVIMRFWLYIATMVWLGLSANAYAATVSIAAIVGEDVITTTDVAERRDLVMATADIPNTEENQKKLTPRIINSLIDETLQLQEAKRQSLTVTDEEVNKAIDSMSAGRKEGDLRAFIKQKGLSERSLQNQMRAQIAWGKVVQRKLRRNVTISEDEVARSQKATAASPGEPEVRVAALELVIAKPEKEQEMTQLAEQLALELKAGTDMPSLASRYIKQQEVRFNPPVWIPEKNLPLPLQQALRSLKPGEASPPIRAPKAIQILQLIERRTTPKQADSTEYAIKQIAIAVPQKRDKANFEKLEAVTNKLRADYGSCMDDTIPQVDLPTQVKFVRAKLGAMSPEQRSIVSHLEVGDVTEPLLAPDAVRLVILCEKIEPPAGNLPHADQVRQELFVEKMELEAQKHLRNLRRDAFIDVKGTGE